MEFKDRLKRRKHALKLTTEALSERSGVPRGTINKLLIGETRNPTSDTVRALAEALQCTAGELLGETSHVPAYPERNAPKAPASLPTRAVPLLGTIAAGRPLYCDEVCEVLLCPDLPGCDFALRVSGDSMNGARVRDGDLVFFRTQSDVPDGSIAAVEIDGHATMKRLYHTRDGVTLLSENPAYKPMQFRADEHDRVRVLGQAVRFMSELG